MTIEFKFHPPQDPLAPSQQDKSPFVLLTHKNNIDTPLLALIQHMMERKRDTSPEWVQSMVFPHPDDQDSFHPPDCVMRAERDPRIVFPLSGMSAYYRFDLSKSLMALLRHTQIVEFPTIEVWEEFRGTVIDDTGAVTQRCEGNCTAKRVRSMMTGRKNTMNTLLGAYGSDEEQGKPKTDVFSRLGEYTDADEGDMDTRSGHTSEAEDSDMEIGDNEFDIPMDLLDKLNGREKWERDLGEDDGIASSSD